MRCFNYHLFLVLCISYCRFVICGSPNQGVTSTLSNTATLAVPAELSDLRADVKTESIEAVEETHRTKTVTKKVISKKYKALQKKMILILLFVFLLPTCLHFIGLWGIRRWKSRFARATDKYKPVQLGELPPVNTKYFGSEADPSLSKPDVIPDHEEIINEIKRILDINPIQKKNLGDIDLSSAQPIAPMDPAILNSFGNLQLQGLLGKGYDSDVYLATCPENGLNLALKVLKDKKAIEYSKKERAFVKGIFKDDDPGANAFAKGAKMGQNFLLATYEGTIPAIDKYLETTEDIYTVLIYEAKSMDLHGLVQRDRALDILSMKTKEYIASRLLLSALHFSKTGYVHNEFKPENILIDENANIVLCDYGSIRVAGEKEIDDSRYSVFITEPERYMTLINDSATYLDSDARSDFYSVGASLHYIFTGRFPFELEEIKDEDETFSRLFTKLVVDNPKLDTDRLVRDGVSERWRNCIVDLLENVRGKRIKPAELVKKYSDLLGIN